MKIKSSCISIIGKIRDNHEDNFYFNNQHLKEKNNGLDHILFHQTTNGKNKTYAIFDGMGGLPYGEKASLLAALQLKKEIKENSSYKMKNYFKNADERIKNYKNSKIKMGTTVSLIRFLEDQIEIGNIGDSRIYFLKGKRLIQVSKDHTEKIIFDELNIELNRKPKLIEYLGLKEEGLKVHPHIKKYRYSSINKILMCTDGLTDIVSDEEIEKVLLKEESIENNIKELLSLVEENGSKDNTTIMIFKIEKE